MADAADKWTCAKCTYENFPASTKCVLCKFPRSAQSVSAVDIYNLGCQPIHKVQNTKIIAANGDDAVVDHWACSSCTLLNAIWLERCSACNSKRDSSTNSTSVKSNSSCSPPRVNRAPSHTAVSATRLASYLPKWRCGNCTYDNFPKSLRCVMCQRPKSATDSSVKGIVERVSATHGGVSPDTVSPRMSPQGSILNLNEACATLLPNESKELPGFLKQPSSDIHGPATAYSDGASGTTARRHNSPALPNIRYDVATLFVNACKAICEGSSEDAINLFLVYGGDPRQQITSDDIHLIVDGAMACHVHVGQNLIDLAVAFNHESVVQLLLNAVESLHNSQHYEQMVRNLPTRRRCVLPCQLCPDLASDVRFLFGAGLRQAKEPAFPCSYFGRDPVTFSLPSDIYSLPSPVRKQLLEDIVDHQVQTELENEGVLNWSAEVVFSLGSRLYALCNRAAGDCLLDSVMQTMWGVMDRSNVLRRAMSSALYEAENAFCQRWRSYETAINERLGFTLDESQWDSTWQKLLDFANCQGQSLEELHIFVLAHVLRRPIIVYSPNFVRSRVSGDKIGESSFQGVYLPLLWDRQVCHKNPIALAYTLGHFSAILALQSKETTVDPRGSGDRVAYLPLQDSDGKLFPIHFSCSTGTRRLLTEWLDCWKTCRTHVLVAQQRLDSPPLVVRQMLTEWLLRYSSFFNACTAVSSCEKLPRHCTQQPATTNEGSDDERRNVERKTYDLQLSPSAISNNNNSTIIPSTSATIVTSHSNSSKPLLSSTSSVSCKADEKKEENT